MSALTWDVLSPWGADLLEDTPTDFALPSRLSGCDRYVMIRRDFLPEEDPDEDNELFFRHELPSGSVDRILRREVVGAPGKPLAAFYVHTFTEAGLDLVPCNGDQWLIRKGQDTVGAVMGVTARGPCRGRVPGDDLTREGVIAQAIGPTFHHGTTAGWSTAWTLAEVAVDALDKAGLR